jgi:hypothetical protein
MSPGAVDDDAIGGYPCGSPWAIVAHPSVAITRSAAAAETANGFSLSTCTPRCTA